MGISPADPEETHAVSYGVLDVPGISGISSLTTEENVNYKKKRYSSWFSVFLKNWTESGVHPVMAIVNDRLMRCSVHMVLLAAGKKRRSVNYAVAGVWHFFAANET
jgi:hypothetical protein